MYGLTEQEMAKVRAEIDAPGPDHEVVRPSALLARFISNAARAGDPAAIRYTDTAMARVGMSRSARRAGINELRALGPVRPQRSAQDDQAADAFVGALKRLANTFKGI